MSNPLTQFRIIALAEGISFLVLLAIAMPLKYLAGNPEPVRIFGWIHGGLFILYIIAVFRAAHAGRWPVKWMAEAFIASLLPFGPFVFDHKLKRESTVNPATAESESR